MTLEEYKKLKTGTSVYFEANGEKSYGIVGRMFGADGVDYLVKFMDGPMNGKMAKVTEANVGFMKVCD